MKKILLFILLSAIIFSCKNKAKLQHETINEGFNKEIQEVPDSNFNFFSVSANISGNFLSDPSIGSFNGQLRMAKDSIIWLTLSKFGFEAIRIKMTTDSFYLIQKLEKIAIVRPIEDVRSFIGFLPNITAMQNLLLGRHQISEEERQFITVQYDDYQTVDNRTFANNIHIKTNAMMQVEFILQYSKVEFDKVLDFPFSIASSYERY
jgi:hypothetical protein